MSANNGNTDQVVSNTETNDKLVPATASSTPNYGTMDASAINTSQPQPQVELSADEKSHGSSSISSKEQAIGNKEPPKPAARRRTQQQLAAATMDSQDTQNELGTIKESGFAQNESKQLVSLPLPEDFEIVHKQHQENIQELTETQPQVSIHCQRPYPKKVIFIVANEFCERFSYYGLKTVLLLYFKSVLDFSESVSTVSFHLFATLCYLTPIFGAILGDSVWGKYKTILYLSIVYFIGEVILVLSSVFWDFGGFSAAITFIGLLLIGMGTGGIKPCVSAFGGDQFHSHETQWRESFFSIFYAAINLGSLISTFLTPLLRSNYQCVGRGDCYPYAFGLPCAIMLVAILIFVAAQEHYTRTTLPEKNVILAFCQCVWLALKRKFFVKSEQNLDQAMSNLEPLATKLAENKTEGQLNGAMTNPSSENTSNSSLSMNSGPDEQLVVVSGAKEMAAIKDGHKQIEPVQKESIFEDNGHDHWLYLASDRFSANEIEDFRGVLGILLLFLPTPIYWCLYDQQGSLWTLQATRMDGLIPGTSFTLEPEQIAGANPLLLLILIALFQTVIYPSLNRCNLITTPIQRMTTGGLITAMAFIASALIEFNLIQNVPSQAPPAGFSRLLIVNGLDSCSMVKPVISYIQIPQAELVVGALGTMQARNNKAEILATDNNDQHPIQLESLAPLTSRQINLLSPSTEIANQTMMNSNPLNNYQIKFKLANGLSHQPQFDMDGIANNVSENHRLSSSSCPLDSSQSVELSIGVLPEKSTKLIYIVQGNGRLGYKLFEDSMELETSGKAKVRLIYDSFGSLKQALSRQFNLVRAGASQTMAGFKRNDNHQIKFNLTTHDGSVLISDYMDANIASTRGDSFRLQLTDLIENSNEIAAQLIKAKQYDPNVKEQDNILLKPGTRNLIIVHQKDATTFEFRHEVLQDNKYRISILFQLIPYILISISEVMFCITALEFSYAMAPSTMKSLILGVWSLTTAFGNLLTVFVEAINPFANLAYDFLLYAFLMTISMVAFAFIGYYYTPHKPKSRSQSGN